MAHDDPLAQLTSDAASVGVLLAHGSLNKIFLTETDDLDQVMQPEQLRDWVHQVRALNDPDAGLGGGDGLYLIEAAGEHSTDRLPRAQFFNADGSLAALCGNGMRCVMRLLMQRRGVDELTVQIGTTTIFGKTAADLAPGVPSVAIGLPPISFSTNDIPMLTEREQFIEQRIPALHPQLRFTAVAVPNHHLVALVEEYDEALLVELGGRIAAGMDELPEGINLSFVQPIAETELFVRTYERGSGLTPSCGSGNVASRSVAARLGVVAPHRRVVLRNSGGVAASWLDGLARPEDGSETPATFDWAQARPYLEGNATWVFSAQLDRQRLREGGGGAASGRSHHEFPAEQQAYQQVWQTNRDALTAAGITLPT